MLIQNPRGNYSFLKGISPYSGGTVAMRGYEIEHVRLQPMRPLKEGFETIERHLKSVKRPRQALCGIELRIPHPFTFEGFQEFNAGYVEVLKRWDVLQDGLNPVARTNVAPETRAPAEPSLYGFSYTVPAQNAPTTFIVAGAGELPEGSLDPHEVVRRGESSTDALREKARFVMRLMQTRLRGLGVDWFGVTQTQVYTVHQICPFIREEILQSMGPAVVQGLTWHHARPPIVSIEYEMDMRGVRRELVL